MLESEGVKSYLATGSAEFDNDDKLAISVACMLTFIQDNFTGPDLDESFRLETIDDKENAERILIDGIELNANIRHVSLLTFSGKILDQLVQEFPSDLVSHVTTLLILQIVLIVSS